MVTELTVPTPPELLIRAATASDAAALATLHLDGLPGAFLPTLGQSFLRQLYLTAVAEREAVVPVAEASGDVVGFAAGVVSIRAFYRRFCRSRGLHAALAAAPRLMRPTTMRRLLETARYPRASEALPDAELLAIAMRPEWRVKGVGRRLAQGVIAGLGDLGVDQMKVVVGADNLAANSFYSSLGFRYARRIAVHDGAASNVWVIRCHL